MPTLDDVYRKFGEVAEAGQLLETDLGTALLFLGAVEDGTITPALEVDSERASALLRRINRQTLGSLVNNCKRLSNEIRQLEPLLLDALDERNRLAHSFYRQHNLRRNSEGGRAIMLRDLESMHETIIAAYKALNRLMGVDLDALVKQMKTGEAQVADAKDSGDGPTTHLPI